MSDDRIADFLNAGAPPQRDPVFRIKVLERREHRRFQRRSFTMLAAIVATLLISALAIGIGGLSFETTAAIVVGTALAVAYPAFRRTLPRILSRLSL